MDLDNFVERNKRTVGWVYSRTKLQPWHLGFFLNLSTEQYINSVKLYDYVLPILYFSFCKIILI